MILYCKYAHFYPIVTKKILKGTACGMKQIKTHYDCSLELAMELVGGNWKLVLLWQLLGGAKRFSELKRKLGDITQKMLTLQLRELEAAGLLTRTVYPVIPPHVEYSLTERGMALAPMLRGLCAWSGKYAVDMGCSPWLNCHHTRKLICHSIGSLGGKSEDFPLFIRKLMY